MDGLKTPNLFVSINSQDAISNKELATIIREEIISRIGKEIEKNQSTDKISARDLAQNILFNSKPKISMSKVEEARRNTLNVLNENRKEGKDNGEK